MEATSFHSIQDDISFDAYIRGEGSRFGYIFFNKYYVNLDTGLPNPFIHIGDNSLTESKLGITTGYLMNPDEDLTLNKDFFMSPANLSDFNFRQNYLKTLNTQEVKREMVMYSIQGTNALFDHINDFDVLVKILDSYLGSKYTYAIILLKNRKGKSPLDLGIDTGSAKVIELFFKYLNMISYFNLSRSIYKSFPVLLDMDLKAFQ